jgi:MoaA/NifB/PqqE/SkfB family radical SAM enzyme
MCNIWKYPTTPDEEIAPDDLESLPHMTFTNITGGEPFLREDLDDIVSIIERKSDRIVISTNGYFTDRVIALAERHPKIGIRISLEGLPSANDELRGLEGGFDHGLRTLLQLRSLGLKDIGFGITASDRNARDIVELYQLADAMGVEFATAVVHNGFYFHKFDNRVESPEILIDEITRLVTLLLRSRRPKNWFRAYFNYGLINRIRGDGRLLPCGMGRDVFFVDPLGDVRACNVLDEVMGNLKDAPFQEIWSSDRAAEVRRMASQCGADCWMTGSAVPAMRREPAKPAMWVLRNKARVTFGRPADLRP